MFPDLGRRPGCLLDQTPGGVGSNEARNITIIGHTQPLMHAVYAEQIQRGVLTAPCKAAPSRNSARLLARYPAKVVFNNLNIFDKHSN